MKALVHILLIGLSLQFGFAQPGVESTPTPSPTPLPSLANSLEHVNSVGVPIIPVPLLAKGHPVDWWFVFKFNSKSFPACGGTAVRTCTFGGSVQPYKAFGQQFVFSSSEKKSLQKGDGCVGETGTDPVGATFDEAYSNLFFFVVWNDQFYDDPKIKGCTKSCSAPWGHSKGMLVWNESGEGFVLQVTTPSWPASGNKVAPRQIDGNTLGCISDDNVEVSQHFFALKLNKEDVIAVLQALQNASVVTDPSNPQIVHNGGPDDIQHLVSALGRKTDGTSFTLHRLSTGVELISKPSKLNVPPWQLVSAILGGTGLRTATWWTKPKIDTTTATSIVKCWTSALPSPGPVEIATTGHWGQTKFGLTGGSGTDFNHAKLGISTNVGEHLTIFGDMNQQGSLAGPNCESSQNGRGGLFYVIDDNELFENIKDLIGGDTAPPLAGSN
jgi:hypothetical protein